MGSTKIMKVALFAAVALLILVVPNFAAIFTCNVYALGMNAGQKTCDAGSRCYQSLLPDSQGGAPLIVSGCDNYQKDGKTAYMCTDFGLSRGQCCTMPSTNQKVNCIADNKPSSAPQASDFTSCSSTCTTAEIEAAAKALAGWVIGIIVVVVLCFVCGIGGIIICCCCMGKAVANAAQGPTAVQGNV